MSETVNKLKRTSLENRIAALSQEYQAIDADLTNEPNPTTRTRLQRALEAKAAEIAKLETELTALGPAPIPTPITHSPAPAALENPLVTDRIVLRKALIDNFKLEELKLLCEDLGIDYEDLSGESKSGKALDLVQYFERRGQIKDLAAKIRQERPNAGI